MTVTITAITAITRVRSVKGRSHCGPVTITPGGHTVSTTGTAGSADSGDTMAPRYGGGSLTVTGR